MHYRKYPSTREFAGHSRNPIMPEPAVLMSVRNDKAVPAGLPAFMLHYAKQLALLYGSVLGLALFPLLFRHPDGTKPQQNQFVEKAAVSSADTGLSRVVRLAGAFKSTLNKEQAAQLQLTYSKSEAVRWSNFPQAFSRPGRVGLPLSTLSPTQTEAFKTLMTSVLSHTTANEGYDELEGIREADNAIAKATGKTDAFGAGNYYLAFLGTPGTASLWELQYGGHHYAFANTYDRGKLTGVTPTFRGTEPMTPVNANNRSYQPLEGERAAFAGVIESLPAAKKAAAKLSQSFSDVLLGPGKDGMFPSVKQGIRIGDLTKDCQQQVLKAIGLYTNDLDEATAGFILKKYTSELNDTYLAYAGSGAMNGVNDYIRIDGPSIWMEYSAQPSRDIPGPPHAHSVWRDRKTDYGGN